MEEEDDQEQKHSMCTVRRSIRHSLERTGSSPVSPDRQDPVSVFNDDRLGTPLLSAMVPGYLLILRNGTDR